MFMFKIFQNATLQNMIKLRFCRINVLADRVVSSVPFKKLEEDPAIWYHSDPFINSNDLDKVKSLKTFFRLAIINLKVFMVSYLDHFVKIEVCG